MQRQPSASHAPTKWRPATWRISLSRLTLYGSKLLCLKWRSKVASGAHAQPSFPMWHQNYSSPQVLLLWNVSVDLNTLWSPNIINNSMNIHDIFTWMQVLGNLKPIMSLEWTFLEKHIFWQDWNTRDTFYCPQIIWKYQPPFMESPDPKPSKFLTSKADLQPDLSFLTPARLELRSGLTLPVLAGLFKLKKKKAKVREVKTCCHVLICHKLSETVCHLPRSLFLFFPFWCNMKILDLWRSQAAHDY